MKLTISEQIREKYPDLRLGIVVAKNVNNKQYKNELEVFCKSEFETFVQKFDNVKELDNQKNIIAWREIYRSFGVNPKKKKPTAESLLSRAIKSNYYPHINAAVDAYLCAETKHFLPIGGYDMDYINGDIQLRYANELEAFLAVGSTDEEYTLDGEVIYSDEEKVLTRCWNYKDCDASKITEETNYLALFVEGVHPDITDDEIKETVSAICHNLSIFCDADCEVKYLDQSCNEIQLL